MKLKQNPLDKLADIYKILPFYRDNAGAIHNIDEISQKNILAAMGANVKNNKDILENINKAICDDYKKILPSIIVLKKNDIPYKIEVNLNACAKTSGTLNWKIVCEDNKKFKGSIDILKLQIINRKKLNSKVYTKRTLLIDANIDYGYHLIEIEFDGKKSVAELVIVPDSCYVDPALKSNKLWGIAVQLYSLRHKNDWGIGDFTALKDMIDAAKKIGAEIIGINPICALFPERPNDASPYYTNDRRFLNFVYIDVEQVPEFKQILHLLSSDFMNNLKTAKNAEIIDYGLIYYLKLEALKKCYEYFISNPSKEFKKFKEFINEQGEALAEFSCFQSLSQHFAYKGAHYYGDWPKEYKNAASSEVADFKANNLNNIEFYSYLQWLAFCQLKDAAKYADKNLALGICFDLPVGEGNSAFVTWQKDSINVKNFSVGCPPDAKRPKGQNWSLAPENPTLMQENKYQSFKKQIIECMMFAKAIRIDHAMRLERLFWVKDAKISDDAPIIGSYIKYPLEDLTGIIALESHRHKCMVIGEDLGTLPSGFREKMWYKKILSTKEVFREHDDYGNLLKPEKYPELSTIMIGTHDNPTLNAFWQNIDIEVFKKYHLFVEENQYNLASNKRKSEKRKLLELLNDLDLWNNSPEEIKKYSEDKDVPKNLYKAFFEFIGMTKSMIAMIKIEDLLELKDMVNVPGTYLEHPNWRIRIKELPVNFHNIDKIISKANVLNKYRSKKL